MTAPTTPCAECGGKPETCGVCALPIEGECVSDSSAEPCCDGGHWCKGCASYTHTRCWDVYAGSCRECGKDNCDDGLQRDDERERVRDMNAMLRGGRFYR